MAFSDVPATAAPDETISVVGEVTNTGGLAGEQPITLRDGLDTIGEDELTVEPRDSATVEFDADVSAEAGGSVEFTLESDDDSVTATFAVVDPETIHVDTDLSETTEPGETLSADVEIVNDGYFGFEVPVRIFVGDSVEFAEPVSIGAGEEVTLTAEAFYTVEEADQPDLTARVVVGVAETSDTISMESETDRDRDDPNGDGDDTDGDGTAADDDDTTGDDVDTDPVDEDADDDGPGFGVGGAIASLGGLGYLLKRRVTETDAESE